MTKQSKCQRGFTLIEVLIVLGILVLLASAAIVALIPQQAGARIDTCKVMLNEVSSAMDVYNLNIGHYPNEQEGGLEALLTKPTFENATLGDQWRGPYLKREPIDPWKNKIHYELTAPGTPEAQQMPYRLWSNGPDLMDGTEDDIKYPEERATSTTP